jgi:hypothetical protein
MIHLQHNGVEFMLGRELTALHHTNGTIGAAQVREIALGRQTILTADAFVSAMPLDAFVDIAARSSLESPTVAHAATLKTDWMSGIQLYFEGHHNTHEIVACIGSPWALTFASEHEIWKVDFASVGNGRAGTLLSVIISDWDRPGYLGGTGQGLHEGTDPRRNLRNIGTALRSRLSGRDQGNAALRRF